MKLKLIESTKDRTMISIPNKVDGHNSDELKKSIHQLRYKHPGGDLVLDMDGLEYISSAGLRLMLDLSKEEKDHFKIVNVSWKVMETFSMTGFTKMMKVSKKMKSISLDGCEQIGKGANSDVFHLDDERIVKLFAEGTSLDIIKRERSLSQKAISYGIPTAISFEIVKCGERYGSVFELLNAKTLSKVLQDNPAAFDTYAVSYVELYKSLHQTEINDKGFPSIKNIYHNYIDDCTEWYTPEQLNLLHRIVDSIPDRKTLIHGDFHANNIMVVDGELVLIDMGDMSYGHPIFDFLATASTQANLVKLNPAFAEVHTNMPVAMITKLWNYLTETYFADKTDAERMRIEQQILLFSKLKVALAPAVGKGVDISIIRASVNDAIDNFLSRADELIGAVDW